MTDHTSQAALSSLGEDTRREVLHRCYSLLLRLAAEKKAADRCDGSEAANLSATGGALPKEQDTRKV